MVPRFRCSAMNLSVSCISSWVSGSSRPGKVSGAPGSSSIAWSHSLCCGNLCDSSSLKTFLCLRNRAGIRASPVIGSVVPALFIISADWFLEHRIVNLAFSASGVLRMMGSWVWSIHPFLQSILGCMAANQGYPSMSRLSPRLLRKK